MFLPTETRYQSTVHVLTPYLHPDRGSLINVIVKITFTGRLPLQSSILKVEDLPSDRKTARREKKKRKKITISPLQSSILKVEDLPSDRKTARRKKKKRKKEKKSQSHLCRVPY